MRATEQLSADSQSNNNCKFRARPPVLNLSLHYNASVAGSKWQPYSKASRALFAHVPHSVWREKSNTKHAWTDCGSSSNVVRCDCLDKCEAIVSCITLWLLAAIMFELAAFINS